MSSLPKKGAHIVGHNIKQVPLLNKLPLHAPPPRPFNFLNSRDIQEKHVSIST